MTYFAVIIAVLLAYLAFRFVKGVIKFALLAVIILLVLLVVVGAQHGSSMPLIGRLR